MPIRVITGSAKGRKLKMVPGGSTRPVMDRVKEACFNIIGWSIEGARFLDLFAGTGSVGIEALSRGAADAVFVETNPLALRTIRENLRITKLEVRAKVMRADVFRYLRDSPAEGFDYIYIAPPQYKEMWSEALLMVDNSPDFLYPDGVAIAQIDPQEFQTLDLKHLELYDQRTYGQTMLNFYERTSE